MGGASAAARVDLFLNTEHEPTEEKLFSSGLIPVQGLKMHLLMSVKDCHVSVVSCHGHALLVVMEQVGRSSVYSHDVTAAGTHLLIAAA